MGEIIQEKTKEKKIYRKYQLSQHHLCPRCEGLPMLPMSSWFNALRSSPRPGPASAKPNRWIRLSAGTVADSQVWPVISKPVDTARVQVSHEQRFVCKASVKLVKKSCSLIVNFSWRRIEQPGKRSLELSTSVQCQQLGTNMTTVSKKIKFECTFYQI